MIIIIERGGVMFSFLFGMAFAGDPIPEIIVESRKDIEVFVAPTEIINKTKIPYHMDSTSVFGHTINDVSNAQKLTQYGYVSMDDDISVYNPDTIKFAWDNCDYSINYRQCSHENGHYLLESYIVFNKEQVTVRLILFDENMKPVAQTVQNNSRIVKIFKKQKVSRAIIPMGGTTVAPRRQCGPTSCSTIRGGVGGSISAYTQTTTEDLEPSVIIIEPKLLDRDIQQASVRLWTSIRIY
tara:strand:+ start:173 stop:889 length:717 start_codon:yes stop_codon:yes gene_type:complete